MANTSDSVHGPVARTRTLLHRFVHPDGDAALAALRKEVRRLAARLDDGKALEVLAQRIERLEDAQRTAAEIARRAERTAMQTKLVAVLNRRDRADIDRLPAQLEDARVAEHVRNAIASAPLLTDPYEHIVVERVLPDAVYELLVRAIPPAEFFSDRDPIKQDLPLPMEFAPDFSSAVWGFVDDVLARHVIRTAVLEKFHGALQRHFETVFGPAAVDRANLLPQSVSGGRLMLRRPGYHLAPHRDPKRVMLTCLLYLAREGDSETHGTQIFRVPDDDEAAYKQTFFPEEEGRRCELVKVVPFKPNTMLVSLNSRGAHGATIPKEAPADLERYTYQFYVAPQREALSALIKSLSPEQRARWQNKAGTKAELA